MSAWDRWLGHGYTLGPFLERKIFPVKVPKVEAYLVRFNDPTSGPVELTGELLRRGSKALTVVVHGLGGNVESGYMRATLAEAGLVSSDFLLLNLRGADRRGFDFNHAGLVADLEAVLADPIFADKERLYLLGYSLGGHLALCYAAGNPDLRLQRVAAVSSPLDLSITADAFDRPRLSVYRRHVMESLYQIYTRAYQRNPRGITPLEARRIERIREWDERVVAPRHGFQGAAHYYAEVSVAARLRDLKVPSLYLGALQDPMVPPAAAPYPAAAPNLRMIWAERGGHLGFPQDLDLGLAGRPGLFPQVLRWLVEGEAPRS